VSGGLRVVVEADGGSRGNPGLAGYGAVVREAGTGEVLLERAETIGVATNNVAEYSGLIAGLQAAADLGAAQVDVRMDSKLVVEQMAGRWQIKHPGLRPLAAQAAALVRRFDAVTYTWIPRERNKHADALANAAMDGKPVGTAVAPAVAPVAEPARDVAAPDSPARAAARRVAADAASAGRRGAQPAAAPVQSPAPAQSPAQVQSPAPVAGAGRPPSSGWEPPTASPTRLVLVRHGETELTAQRRYSGRGDVPLSEQGRQQALAVAERLRDTPAAAVVSSPLARCRQTADAIAAALGGVPVRVDDALVECDFGAWEGRTFAEVRTGWAAELDAWLGCVQVAPPGGESFAAVGERVAGCVERLRAEYPERTVVVVSHVSPIKLLLRDALAADDALLHRLYLDPAGVSVVDLYADGGVAVRGVNDVSHLR
jgi:probable phosphoglycerate mutase